MKAEFFRGQRRFTFWLLLLFVASPLSALAQPATPSAIDYREALQKLASAVEYEVAAKSIPSLSMTLVDRDRIVYAEGFGFQDPARETPATADTIYRVGSVSKLFTDIAVMQLVESGDISLDEPVQTYLPEFQPRNEHNVPITLRQLMSHRSGLVRESPVGNYFDPTEPILSESVASLNATALVYPPNTKTKYSNAAVAVVGAVLETKLQRTHAEQVQRAIFTPLGMQSSSFDATPQLQPKLATGWMRTYDGRRFEAPTFQLGTGPAGNLFSSTKDLAKFIVWLLDQDGLESSNILSAESLSEMLTPVEDSQGEPQGFGLGFHIQKLGKYVKIGHGGAVYGFSTQLEILPERSVGVAAAASLDGANGVVARLSEYALQLMVATQDDQPLPEYSRTAPVPRARADELVGKYREVDGERFTLISRYQDELIMQRGTFQNQIRASVDDGRLLTDDCVNYGTPITVSSSDVLRVGETDFQRLPDSPPAPAPAHWAGLIGEYGWDHNTLYILEEDEQLYALIEWFYYYPLQELGENEFAFPDYGLYHGEKLIFSRNEQGEATQVLAAEVPFERREVGTKHGETFRIKPVQPIADLREAAMQASPPKETGDFHATDLVDLTQFDPGIRLDIRYATTNNFTGEVFYKQPRAFLQRPAAKAVANAHQELSQQGLGLLIHDAYRPWYVTKMFWDATPTELKDFVANPANGSRHNRGCAVDLTLYDLETGQPIEMVAGYDEFSPRSFPLYPGGTSRQRWYRELLRRTMESHQFTIYEFEWWHFDFQDWERYRLGNQSFETILKDD